MILHCLCFSSCLQLRGVPTLTLLRDRAWLESCTLNKLLSPQVESQCFTSAKGTLRQVPWGWEFLQKDTRGGVLNPIWEDVVWLSVNLESNAMAMLQSSGRTVDGDLGVLCQWGCHFRACQLQRTCRRKVCLADDALGWGACYLNKLTIVFSLLSSSFHAEAVKEFSVGLAAWF